MKLKEKLEEETEIRKEEENSVKYYGIRNRNAIINESDIDELMGYIVETTTV